MGGWETPILHHVWNLGAVPTQPHAWHRAVPVPRGQLRTFGPHGRRAVVRYGREDAGVIADVGVGLPADVAIVRVEGGGAGDEIGTD